MLLSQVPSFSSADRNLQPPQDDQTMQKGGPPDDAAAGEGDVSMRSESEGKRGDRRFILVYPAAVSDD